MGNAPSKTPNEKKRRPTSFYGKRFTRKSSDDGKASRRRSLPATNPSTKEYNGVVPLNESDPNISQLNSIVPLRESYLLSVLEEEQDQLIDEHHIHKVTWGQNFMAPIKDMLTNGTEVQVLDVGCGNGKWILEVAAEFPLVKFIGIDTTNTMPSDIKLPNVEFRKATLLGKLDFDDETFDFVHCRSVYTSQEWSTLVNELVRVAKFGGYVELLEQDFNWVEEASISKIVQLRTSKDVDFKPSLHISRAFHANPHSNQIFHQVRQEKLGVWGGKAGKLRVKRQISTLKNLKTQMLNTLGMTSEEYDETIYLIEKELFDGRNYVLAHRFWVQKKK